MDAKVGRYRVRMEENGLILGHEAGINFEMTIEETWMLLQFLSAYQQTLQSLREDVADTEPLLRRVRIKEQA